MNNVKVMVTGKNVSNYAKWIIKQNINIIKLDIVKYNKLYLIINYNDYSLLNKYSKTYEVSIVKKYGSLRIIDGIKENVIILSCLILSIFFLYLLSHIIFNVEVVYNDKEMVTNITNELAKYNVSRFKKKKSYAYLEQVKKKILEDNKDTLEWLEIEEYGTKYIVRLVERKQERNDNSKDYQSIISKKDAIITKIVATNGEKVKSINEYVKKGDTIISGVITKPDGSNIYTVAMGNVYGEVWYKVKVEYPLYYQEEKLTGKSRGIISFYFLNKNYSLFLYKKYKNFKLITKTILENNVVPFRIAKERIYETMVTEEIYTGEEAIMRAIAVTKDKFLHDKSNIINIKNIQIIEKEISSSKVSLTLFVSAIEDITDVVKISQENGI
jgi:similar to stage IV sporulation protein